MTSQTESFNLTQNAIITRSLNLLNVFEANETPTADDFNMVGDFLNMMVKHWAAMGIHLFERRTGFLFLQPSQSSYLIEATSSDHCTEEYIPLTTTVTVAATATVLTFSSTEGVIVGDNIGVVLDSGTLYWTNVLSTTSTTITLAAGIPSSVTAGNLVFDYTVEVDKPLRIHYGFRRDAISLTDIPMTTWANKDYWDMPVKTSLGTPLNFYYDIQVNNGTLLLWPTPALCTDIVGFSFDKRISDFDSASDYPDFPSEWLRAIVYNLACDIAPAYGKFAELQFISAKADSILDDVKAFDQEEADIQLTVGTRGMNR
jgi:hypothetical protein